MITKSTPSTLGGRRHAIGNVGPGGDAYLVHGAQATCRGRATSSLRPVFGFEFDDDLDRLLVISPHLDDAVISCGALLLADPGATVVTLFAASPAEYTNPLNEHDTECGFQPGDDTMAVRRDEDVRGTGGRRRAAALAGLLPAFARRARRPDRNTARCRRSPRRGDRRRRPDVRRRAARAPAPRPPGDTRDRARGAARGRTTVRGCGTRSLPYAYVPRVLAARLGILHRAGWVASPVCPPRRA